MINKHPPKTRTDNVKNTLHGVEIIDPYRWLEEPSSKETQEWLRMQAEYTRSHLDALPGREQIRQRLEALNNIDVVSLPLVRKGCYFFLKRLAHQELSAIYMRVGWNGTDEVLIDPHSLGNNQTVSVNILAVCPQGTLLAYGVRRGGEDEVAIRFFNVKTRQTLPDRLPRGRYFSVTIRSDQQGCYYCRHEQSGPRVYYHSLGTDSAEDLEIFGSGFGPDKLIEAELSENESYLILTVFHNSIKAGPKSEIYVQDLAKNGSIRPIVNDIDARFTSKSAGNYLFVLTNWQADKGRILQIDLKHSSREHWREVLPQQDDPIYEFTLTDGKLLVHYLHNVTSILKIFEPTGKYLYDIALPSLGTVGGISGNWSTSEVFYNFNSFHIPPIIYQYNLERKCQSEWAQQQVPFQSDRFEVQQVWYTSNDGTGVPMFIVHRKNLQPTGDNPTLLMGYGGFNISQRPSFSSGIAHWLESGGVYALANIRGGGEFGEAWHQAGMGERKQNVFDDFIAAAEWMIEQKYTQPSKLAITGSSNGGLLVAAAMTQRPELFQAVVCRFPLLDMLRYHRFGVGQFATAEYGCAENPEQFKYLYAYSPYHQVKPGTAYPAVIFITGALDTRTDPLHGRKMTARVQAATSSNLPVLLLYGNNTGHAGVMPVSKAIEISSDILIFLDWQLKVQYCSDKL